MSFEQIYFEGYVLDIFSSLAYQLLFSRSVRDVGELLLLLFLFFLFLKKEEEEAHLTRVQIGERIYFH